MDIKNKYKMTFCREGDLKTGKMLKMTVEGELHRRQIGKNRQIIFVQFKKYVKFR